MSLRFPSVDSMPANLRQRVDGHPWKQATSESPKALKRANKYGSKPCHEDGHRFPSRLEGNRYLQLKALKASGEYHPALGRLVTFSLWPVFLLPGGVKAILDSVQVWQDGARTTVIWEDAKGRDNQTSKNKRKQIRALYGIEVQVWP